jgi:hypothetical protein
VAKKRKGSGDTLRIDFSKEVEGGGGGVRIPENDYKGQIIKIKKIRSSEKDTPGLAVTVKVTEGKFKGKKLTDRLWITPKSLWRVRSLLEALGLSVPKKVVNIPIKKIIGKEVGMTVIDDEPYNGRIKSKIGDFVDLETLADLDDEDDEDFDEDEDSDLDEDEDEDDSDEDEDDDDDEDEDDDLEEMDRKELKAHIKENKLKVKVTKKMDADAIREAIEEADDEDEDDDELDLDDF